MPDFYLTKDPALGSDPTSFPAVAGEEIGAGSLVYVSGNNMVSKGDNTSFTSSFLVGIAIGDAAVGAAVEVQQNGIASVRMVGGLSLSPNDLVFLTTDGR